MKQRRRRKNFILGFGGGRKKERIPRRSNSRSLMALKKWGLFQIKSAVSLTIFLLNSTDYYFEAGCSTAKPATHTENNGEPMRSRPFIFYLFYLCYYLTLFSFLLFSFFFFSSCFFCIDLPIAMKLLLLFTN